MKVRILSQISKAIIRCDSFSGLSLFDELDSVMSSCQAILLNVLLRGFAFSISRLFLPKVLQFSNLFLTPPSWDTFVELHVQNAFCLPSLSNAPFSPSHPCQLLLTSHFPLLTLAFLKVCFLYLYLCLFLPLVLLFLNDLLSLKRMSVWPCF